MVMNQRRCGMCGIIGILIALITKYADLGF